MISAAFSIINLLPGDIRKAKEVLKIVDELVSAAAKFQARDLIVKVGDIYCEARLFLPADGLPARLAFRATQSLITGHLSLVLDIPHAQCAVTRIRLYLLSVTRVGMYTDIPQALSYCNLAPAPDPRSSSRKLLQTKFCAFSPPTIGPTPSCAPRRDIAV